jgi:transcriptional regulator with XRE-family HTH domain
MKNKFDNQENGSMLGITIQQVRKAKGITQEDLGRRVGLPKSSISKIEKGLTHISFEDASLLMDAMGEKITIHVMGMKEPDERRVERVRFVTIGVTWYAHSKKMAFADAYRYLLIYKGIQFLEENYAYEQTLSRQTLLDDLDKVCNRNREKLRKAV